VATGAELPPRRSRVAAASRFLGVRRELGTSLVSVAGLVGRPVRGRGGELVGRLADVVVRSEAGYPAVAGFVVRIGPRRAWVHARDVAGVEQGQLRLLSSRFDLQDVLRRPGEIQLVLDVIDQQLVDMDMDGVRVVRAADLYLASPGEIWRLVGVDVSLVSFLRRALPGRPGRQPSPAKVLDWAGVQPFGITGGPVRLNRPNSGVHRLRPAEMADLLEDLGRSERRELLAALDTDMAADALEEMNAPDVLAVLRDAPVERAAELLASMESDEAADALRDLPDDEREDVLRAMPAEAVRELRTLLTYEEETAGGVMTSGMVLVGSSATVGDAVAALRSAAGRSDQQAGVVVVDQDGRLLDDVSVFELLGVAPGRPVAELVGPPWPVTVPPGAGLREVVSTMTDNRGSSIVVVDEQERPIGRILADDVIDALTRRDDRRWPWQRWIGPSS